LSQKEDDIIVYFRNNGLGWAQIARHIYGALKIKRSPNELKNNYNQRLKKSHPDVRPDIDSFLHNQRLNKSRPVVRTDV
jgi:hypothetical protein